MASRWLRAKRLREAFADNHLLRYLWQSGTAYRWSHLCRIALALLLVIAAAVKLSLYMQSLAYIRVMEPELQSMMRDYMSIADLWLFDVRAEGLRVPDSIQIRDRLWWTIVLSMHGSVFVVMILQSILTIVLLKRKRWNSPFADQMRVLPVSPLQVLVARYDIYFLRDWLLLLFGALLLLLPARAPWEFGATLWGDLRLTANATILYWTFAALLFSFGLWRTLLCTGFCRYQVPYLLMLASWIPLFGWLCVLFYHSIMWTWPTGIGNLTMWITLQLALAVPFVMGIYITPGKRNRSSTTSTSSCGRSSEIMRWRIFKRRVPPPYESPFGLRGLFILFPKVAVLGLGVAYFLFPHFSPRIVPPPGWDGFDLVESNLGVEDFDWANGQVQAIGDLEFDNNHPIVFGYKQSDEQYVFIWSLEQQRPLKILKATEPGNIEAKISTGRDEILLGVFSGYHRHPSTRDALNTTTLMEGMYFYTESVTAYVIEDDVLLPPFKIMGPFLAGDVDSTRTRLVNGFSMETTISRAGGSVLRGCRATISNPVWVGENIRYDFNGSAMLYLVEEQRSIELPRERAEMWSRYYATPSFAQIIHAFEYTLPNGNRLIQSDLVSPPPTATQIEERWLLLAPESMNEIGRAVHNPRGRPEPSDGYGASWELFVIDRKDIIASWEYKTRTLTHNGPLVYSLTPEGPRFERLNVGVPADEGRER